MRGRDAEVASVPDCGDGVESVLSQLLEAFLGRPLTAGEFSELNSSYREAEDAGSSERTTYGAALPTTPIGLDALVMVSQLMQSALRRSLIPEESSRLKHAYQVAKKDAGGATLQAVIAALEREKYPQ